MERKSYPGLIMASTNDKKKLRNFGIGFACSLTFFFGLLLPFLLKKDFHYLPFVLALIFLVLAFLKPEILKIPYKLIHTIAKLVEFLLIRSVLTVFFYFIIFPFSLFLKKGIWKRMGKGIDNDLKTYRSVDEYNFEKKYYERPF